jgi:hypothetical protein
MTVPFRRRGPRLAVLVQEFALAAKGLVLVTAAAYDRDPETVFAELRETVEAQIRAVS